MAAFRRSKRIGNVCVRSAPITLTRLLVGLRSCEPM